MTKRTLKVRVTITVEVDRDAYDAEYSSMNYPFSAEDIRQHVKMEAYSATESAFQHIDAITVKAVE